MATQITIDLVLIGRCLGALLWGILWAIALQTTRIGRFLAHERTWITVVIGVGCDLLLGIGALWWHIWLIVAFSSVGIIIRSILNEHRESEPALNKYKTKWAMEAGIGDIITALERALNSQKDAERVRCISAGLTSAHKASREIAFARYGEADKKG